MATRKTQNKGTNSVSAHIEAIARVGDVLPLPAGYTFKTVEEETLWQYFSVGRAVKDWDDGHRVVLYNLVRNQCRINGMNDQLDSQEYTLYNDKGNPFPNPLISMISTMERLVQSNTRLLGLQKTDGESATIKKRAQTAKDAKDTVQKEGKLSLLAKRA